MIQLSPADLQALLTDAINAALTPTRKHAYTVAEVAEQIGYKSCSVLSFIHVGRRNRFGTEVRLPALEITPGAYRIRPDDLDNWLTNFK